MADGAKSAIGVILSQFGHGAIAVYQIVFITRGDGNGITIDILLVILQMLAHPPLMRPYQFGIL